MVSTKGNGKKEDRNKKVKDEIERSKDEQVYISTLRRLVQPENFHAV
jgi:hypothetical protein